MSTDISSLRRQFPFAVRRPELAYLDSAATSQMPEAAIEAMDHAARQGLGGVHRGLHPLADEATTLYENARSTAATFLHAKPSEIVFTKNATEALNLAAHALGSTLKPGDAVAVTRLDHHSNILPWLSLKQRGIDIRWIDIHPDGTLNEDGLDDVRLLAITGQSNVLGTRPDLTSIISRAKAKGILTCIDAAQLAAHTPIDVHTLDCDLLAFSGHKVYGPTGIGVLYGREPLLQSLPPFLVGGGMVRTITDDSFSAADSPTRFEAGTPPVLPAIGLAAALEWQKTLDWNNRIAHEQRLLKLLLTELRSIPGIRILGPGDDTISGCVSFTLEGLHPHDIAEVLGNEGVCVRAGNHCAQPLHTALGIESSVRASIGLYTNEQDIVALTPALRSVLKLFGR